MLVLLSFSKMQVETDLPHFLDEFQPTTIFSLYWILTSVMFTPNCTHTFTRAYAVYHPRIVLCFMCVGLGYLISRFSKSGHPWGLIKKKRRRRISFFPQRRISWGKNTWHNRFKSSNGRLPYISFTKQQRIFGLLPFIWPLKFMVNGSNKKMQSRKWIEIELRNC